MCAQACRPHVPTHLYMPCVRATSAPSAVYVVMAYIVMAYVVMAYLVMAYIVMAYIVTTYILL